MRKLATVMLAVIILTASLSYAGSGDLIVNGNLGVGTTSPVAKLQVTGGVIMATDPSFGAINAQLNGANLPGLNFTRWIGGGAIQDNAYVGQFWNQNTGYYDFSIGTGRSSTGSQTATTNIITVTIGNSSVGIGTSTPAYTLDVNGTIRGSNVSPSDAKFKKNLLPVATPLDKVLGLNGHSYEWKTSEYKEKNFPDGRHYGVIAQEIEKVLPEVVNTDSKGEKSVAYTEIIPVLIEAIKEQQKRIDLLEKKLSQFQQ